MIVGLSLDSFARVGLVTVPKRDAVQITIYNSADLTLVRERRLLTLASGRNRLEFTWAGTLIDPTSIQFEARTHTSEVEVVDLSFPPQAPNALVWHIESEFEGEVAVEISYFTSGLTWSADYEGLVEANGKKMRIESFVKVTNHSGEDYRDAQVRLVVGSIHLVENIADLANRGGRPIPAEVQDEAREEMASAGKRLDWDKYAMAINGSMDGAYLAKESEAPPEIIREGLSEYFLYTVSGVHAVPDQWSVRWPNFSADGVEIENFYRYEENVYDQPERFIRLRNDKAHKLGVEPLPDGEAVIYKSRSDGTRAFIGRSTSKYIPIGESWEIDLGADPDVVVKPTLMRWAITEVEFDEEREVSGWDEREHWKLELLNARSEPVTIEVDRNFEGDFTFSSPAKNEKYDIDTIRFTRALAPAAREEISYVLTTRKGSRAKR